MAMTAVLAESKQWPGSSWLPLIADQILAHDGATFGIIWYGTHFTQMQC